MTYQDLTLGAQWDKTFPKSEAVHHEKVVFDNNYGITLAADLYTPVDAEGALPAIIVCGPFGAVKEQASGLYAQSMAERGFLAMAFDPSFTGESGGMARYMCSPDINTEDYMAAVDYLMLRDDVDPEKIGIIGICGWGGIALNTAIADPRIKATLASTMYDMTRIGGNGYFDANDNASARIATRHVFADQRTQDARNGFHVRAGGVPDKLPEDAPQFQKDYYDYYKTDRGYHPRSLNSNDGWCVTASIPYGNTRFMHYLEEVESPIMILHGEKAHSFYMGSAAYDRLHNGLYPDNKEFVIIPGASHCDLYDGGKNHVIDWAMIADFFQRSFT